MSRAGIASAIVWAASEVAVASANCGQPLSLLAATVIADHVAGQVKLGALPKGDVRPLTWLGVNVPSNTLTDFGGLDVTAGEIHAVVNRNEVRVYDRTTCVQKRQFTVRPESGDLTSLRVAPDNAVVTTFQGNGGGPGIAVYAPGTAGFDVDAVEIIRGPQTALFGKVGGGGVVNLVTKRQVVVTDTVDDSVSTFELSAPVQFGVTGVKQPEAVRNVAPIRKIKGPNTRLDNPTAVWATATHLWVADFEGAGSIKRFPIEASGDVAPDLVLLHPVGSPHRIVFPQDLRADPLRNELWVTDARPSIKVYRLDTPGGDDPPLRTVGSAAGLTFPRELAFVPTPPVTDVVLAALPTTRVLNPLPPASLPGVEVATSLTAGVFAFVINSGGEVAQQVALLPATTAPVTMSYQTTDPLTNALTGTANTPVDIPPGQGQSFAAFFTALAPFDPTQVGFNVAGVNNTALIVIPLVNTVQLVAPAVTTVDPVALAATATADGILNVPEGAAAAFAVAIANVAGVGDTITVSADTGGISLPLGLSLCRTAPATGQCISAVGPSVDFALGPGDTPTVAVFASASASIPFDPAAHRIALRIKNGAGLEVGGTSVAVRTVLP